MHGDSLTLPAVAGVGDSLRAARQTSVAAGPQVVKQEPSGGEAEEIGSGDGDGLSDGGGSEDPDDYEIGGAADARDGDGGGCNDGLQAAAGNCTTTLPVAHRPHTPPDNEPRRKKGPKEGGNRINWNRPVNRAISRTTYTHCLEQAMLETGLRAEDVAGTKQIVTLLLPVVRQHISKAGGDGSCLSYKCLLNKLSRMQKKMELAEDAALARAAAGVGAKRLRDSTECMLSIPTPDPRRPEQRRQTLHENPIAVGLARAPAAIAAVGAPAEAPAAAGFAIGGAESAGTAVVTAAAAGVRPAAAAATAAAAHTGTTNLAFITEGLRLAVASQKPSPLRTVRNPLAIQGAGARDGLLPAQGGTIVAGGAPSAPIVAGGAPELQALPAPDSSHASEHPEETLEVAIALSLTGACTGAVNEAGGAAGTAEGLGLAVASQEPSPSRGVRNPLATQGAGARDGLLPAQGGTIVAGGAPQLQALPAPNSSHAPEWITVGLKARRQSRIVSGGSSEDSVRSKVIPGSAPFDLKAADGGLLGSGSAGADGAGAEAAAGAEEEQLLRTCGMLDDELQGIAAAIALLEPRFLRSLAAAKFKAVDAAMCSREGAASAAAKAAAAAEEVAAARERLRREYVAAGEACLAAAQQLASPEAAAAFDVAASKAARASLEGAEAEVVTWSTVCAKAVERARQVAEMAEADQLAALGAEARYANVVEAAARVLARLGGGGGGDGGGGEEVVGQLPDLVGWAVGFMDRLPLEEQWAAAGVAAAAAREGGQIKEQALRLFLRLPRLQEQSHKRTDPLAFRLSQQIAMFYIRLEVAER
ncbi:hypothetical protein PLESTB_000577800 [Pleodorina starrii]|uniref:Uncharacterized protein n=1 Tax=Pleodorina starrii TaxID=330485 RepID=A0A9W6BHU5_9CHLO|nr:hypothetical protein PLESTB_000577800 [Pleodorina starrii]